MSIDYRKWFDRFQPQTLQIATILLYINGFFTLIDLASEGTLENYIGDRRGALGTLAVLAVVACCAGSGLLMANDRKWGYRLALVAAFAPILLRLWVASAFGDAIDVVTGGRILSFVFEVALIALLLHPHSREHQRIWYK